MPIIIITMNIFCTPDYKYYYHSSRLPLFYHFGNVNCLGHEKSLSDCQQAENTDYCIQEDLQVTLICWGMFDYALYLTFSYSIFNRQGV